MFDETDTADNRREPAFTGTQPAELDQTKAIGFMARVMVQTTMPHRATSELYFQRRNGNLTLTMVGHPDHGLPYGKMPRLLLAWITRQVRITGSARLRINPVKAELFRELGLTASGGPNGSIRALDDQLLRLMKCTIHIDRWSSERSDWKPFQISSGLSLWRDPASRSSRDYWIHISDEFFQEATTNAVPLDFATMRALRSPMAIDIYAWATDRVYRLSRPTVIEWSALRQQFGADYGRTQDFKRAFDKALGSVFAVYPGLRATPQKRGLKLTPCMTHISPRY